MIYKWNYRFIVDITSIDLHRHATRK